MNLRSGLVRIALIMAAGLGLVSGTGAARGQENVSVVRNPKTPVRVPGGPSSLILKEDLVIGREGGEGGGLFAEFRSVGVDDQENIWTLDWEDIKVRIFDKTGKLLTTFGKKGPGPNELQSPYRMIVTGDGTAVIMDLNKIAYYARDGRCLKEVSTAKANSFRMKADRRGFLYLDSWEYGAKRNMRITKYDRDLKPLRIFDVAGEPFMPGTVQMFQAILYFHVTSDDHIIWALTNAYQFNVLDAEGRTIRRISKDYSPRKITAAEEKRLLQDRFGGSAIPAGIKVDIPSAYPPLQQFIGDDEDRLYARTYETDGKGGTWVDVFDKEGRYIARVAFTEGEKPFIIKNNKLYTIVDEDEEGRPLIKRYAMTWK